MKIFNTFLLEALVLFPAAGLLVFAAVTPAARAQDLTLHESTTSTGVPRAGATQNVTQTRYISSKAIKNTSSTGLDVIIQLSEGKIFRIDNNKRTFSEMTVQQLDVMLTKMGSERSGEDNPGAVAAIHKAMGQFAKPGSVIKSGPGGDIAGYATERHVINGPIPMEVWAAPALKMPAIFYDAMKICMMQNPMPDRGSIYDEMKNIQGLPLKTVITTKLVNMDMKTTTVVTSVEKTPIPASTFRVPAGYTLVPNNF
jgi:hypothetical protein